MRPELVILLVLIIAIPLIGVLAYRSVVFQFNEILVALTAHPCIFSSNDGSEWNLNDLSKSQKYCLSSTNEECSDYHLHRQDSEFLLNICNNVMSRPEACRELHGESQVRGSIGYETSDGKCYYMGQLQTGKWSLLDERLDCSI